MDAIKGIFAVVAALVGVVSAVLTAYAKFLDVRERSAKRRAAAQTPAPLPADEEFVTLLPVAVASRKTAPAAGSAPTSGAAHWVKGPAIAVISIGTLSLLFNLLCAGYGLVDRFVTPLGVRHSRMPAAADGSPASPQPSGEISDETSETITIVMFLAFSLAAATAIWAGVNMLRMRSYWLSVAGSVAVMPGGLFCCMAGVPVGVWSLVVLLRTEVRAAFT